MGALLLLFPQDLFVGLQKYVIFLFVVILAAFLYVGTLVVIGGLKKGDVNAFKKLADRSGPLSGVLKKLAAFLERFAT
ncbi:MAG: hypothetical protein A4E27_00989 [Methanobacterium sp. PtaU1.Bin242]|nr:MAG: hypothetical protein A4E27_00989 [Methanobacterium sp. PtaU1.Bin242]